MADKKSQGAGAASGAIAGAQAGTAILPGWGTAIGAVVGGAIGWFGSKGQKAAPTAPFVPVNPADEQASNIAGNLRNFDAASTLAAKTNAFNQTQGLAMMERAMPGFSGLQKRLLGEVRADLDSQTNLPADVQAKIQQFAAEKGITRGTSGNFNGFNLVRDFGFNVIDWKNANRARALQTLTTVSGITPRINPMSPMASMVDPNTAIGTAVNNNGMAYNVNQGGLNAQTAAANFNTSLTNGLLQNGMTAATTWAGGASGPSSGSGGVQAKAGAAPSFGVNTSVKNRGYAPAQ